MSDKFPARNLLQAENWGREVERRVISIENSSARIDRSVQNLARRVDGIPRPDVEFSDDVITGTASNWQVDGQSFTRNGEWVSAHFAVTRLGGTLDMSTGADFSGIGNLADGWRPRGPYSTVAVGTNPEWGYLLTLFRPVGSIWGVRANGASTGTLNTGGQLVIHAYYRVAPPETPSAGD